MYLSEKPFHACVRLLLRAQHHHHPLPRPTRRRIGTHSFVPVRSRTNSPFDRYSVPLPPSNDASPATGALPAVARPYHQTDVSYVGAENQTTSLEEHYAQGGSSAMDAESDLYQNWHRSIGRGDANRAVIPRWMVRMTVNLRFRLRRLYLVHRVIASPAPVFGPHPISQFALRG